MGGIDKSNIYQYFKVLYGLGNMFWGGGSSEDMELGQVIVCLILVP